MSIQTNISDIGKMFVVCKRVKKVPYYCRGSTNASTTSYAPYATLFKTLDEANTYCAEKNAKRSGGHKYRVEQASKHFVNNWSLQLDYYSKQLIVKNNLEPFERVKRTEAKNLKDNLNSQKYDAKEKLLSRIKSNDEQNARAILNYQEDLKNLEKRYTEAQKERMEDNEKCKTLLTLIDNTDFDKEYVEKYATQTDAITKVLYGKREPIEQQTKESTMMILPLRTGAV